MVFGLSVLPAVAQAEVWGFVDERGVAHFAPKQIDARYQLFFKDSRAPIAPQVVGAGDDVKSNIDVSRPVAAPAAAAKLLAFFEVSPNFKAVRHIMREASVAHGIDFELLQALISAESGFDAQAVSPRGAVGLMQLMAPTAQRFGVLANKSRSIEKMLTDPRVNIDAGSRYLRMLINLFPGRLDLAVAAYNAGEGAVQRAGNRVPNIKETQDYVRTVLQLHDWLKPPTPVRDSRNAERSDRNLVTQPVPLAGGARGRGNMVAPLQGATPPQLPSPLPSQQGSQSPTADVPAAPTHPAPTGSVAVSPGASPDIHFH